MKSRKTLGFFLLLFCSFIWGSTFVAQEKTAVQPFTYLAMRSVVAIIFLLPVVIGWDVVAGRKDRVKYREKCKKENKTLMIGGLLCGFFLFVASAAQQIGMYMGTTAGKAGFITATYLLIVPILGLFIGKKVRGLHWICIVLALVGLFLLCMTGGIAEFSLSALFSSYTLKSMTVSTADIFVIASAFLFSFQILAVDKYSAKVDCLKLSFMEFSVVAVLSFAFMFLFEKPTIEGILDSWVSIVYAGVLSSGVAYTLQIFGQKYTNPNIAAMLMSLESPFALVSSIIFALVITGENVLPTGYEAVGCLLMFSAIVVSQLPEKKKKAA
ncbi:MAG: DMT family transporter [Eubacteriales bacterium]|nr:DMT family transporter [Eubacteriales bacterium]